MKGLTTEKRRISLRVSEPGRQGLKTAEENAFPLRIDFGDELRTLSDAERKAELAKTENQRTRLDGDVGGKKPASKNGAMLWRPQLALQKEAWDGFEQANAQLELIVAALQRELYSQELSRFRIDQQKFEEKRDITSRLKAKREGGGSIGKLVQASVAEEMTHERIFELEEKLGKLVPDFRASVLIEALVKEDERSEPTPKLLSIWRDTSKAVNKLTRNKADFPSIASSAERVRSAATAAAYFQWKHPDLDETSRAELLTSVERLRTEGDALLAQLDTTRGLDVDAKDAYAQLLDSLSSVDGVITRLEHGLS